MTWRLAPRVSFAVVTLTLAAGLGCGSTGGGGCAGLKPLPSQPRPHGFPADQIIEGGIQARITKPGVDKLTSVILDLLGPQLQKGFCVSGKRTFGPGFANVNACSGVSTGCAPGEGCTAKLILTSSDGKNGITITVPDGSPPVINLDIKFDFNFAITLGYHLDIFGVIKADDSCTLNFQSGHYGTPSPSGKDPIHVRAQIGLGIDPTTGKLTLRLNDVQSLHLDLGGSNGCGFLGDFLGYIGDGISSFLNTNFGQTLVNFLLDFLRPTLDQLVQSFLPDPLGLAGTFDSGTVLKSFNPPANTNLEVFLLPGGYVSAKSGGLTLGVLSGLNSDRDQTTRAPGLTSEPSLCVPNRPTPELAAAPWMLPFNPARKDFTLQPAGEFAGSPDPSTDVAIGVSRTFFDLAGFHIYNSGTLCLSVGGGAIPQLNGGTLAIIVNSLDKLIENKKAPLALVVRPQVPLNFTIGAGTMTDPLINVAVKDLRVDFYGWVEERFARLFTVGADLNLGVNLNVTKNAQMQPALQPMLTGLNAANITVRVSNTDLLAEDPATLAAVFPTLLNVATSAIGSNLPTIALPSLSGFSLDNISLAKVQTSEDDFLGIYASIKKGAPAPLIDWSDPDHPRVAGEMRTRATVDRVIVPTKEELSKLVVKAVGGQAMKADEKPRVALTLDTVEPPPAGKQVEFGWRIDGGMWRDWTTERNPVIADDAFLLQGKHTIEIRSRLVGEWLTEDSTPAKVAVLIDSIPPELHPRRDDKNEQLLRFGGFDVVSDDGALEYAYREANGERTSWSKQDSMTLADVKRLTNDFQKQLVIAVRDEAGLVHEAPFDVGPLFGFHGRTTDPPSSGGCGCAVGGADIDVGGTTRGAIVMIVAGLFLLVRLRRRTAAASVLRSLIVAAATGALVAGCGCSGNGLQCSIADDCAKMKCAVGELPACEENMCVCNADLTVGDTGRYASMSMIGGDAYVAAYNSTYGDLMIGHVTPPGVISNWDYIDGVPDEAPELFGSRVRGGIRNPGDDVGRYASIGINQKGEPIVAYYDSTNKRLKFAYFSVIRWATYEIDGIGSGIDASQDDIGRWASMSVGPDGRPAIAYTAIASSMTMAGKREGQLRFAQAKVPFPTSKSDWDITVLDRREIADPTMPDGGATSDPLHPEVIALMPSLARKIDGTPGIAYYDRARGNLRFVEYIPAASMWGTPTILDGEAQNGMDAGDVGLYPSLAYDDSGTAHISYVDATRDNLLYINSSTRMPEVVDDGYRPKSEQTLDGLDSPVFHLVGDSSSISVVGGRAVIAYQDSTVLQLRIAQRDSEGKWQLATVAGHGVPTFTGGYGFWANLRTEGGRGIVSSYAINQQVDPALFFVEVFAVDLNIIM
jgi:hypothetical protein